MMPPCQAWVAEEGDYIATVQDGSYGEIVDVALMAIHANRTSHVLQASRRPCGGSATASRITSQPLDAVPEKMPFDVPYGAPVSLERADAVLAAAVTESKNRNWKLVCAVVDSGASLVSFKRMDGAQLASIDIAIHKARASAKYRRESKAFEAGCKRQSPPAHPDDVIACAAVFR
jgi:hypothetical protein